MGTLESSKSKASCALLCLLVPPLSIVQQKLISLLPNSPYLPVKLPKGLRVDLQDSQNLSFRQKCSQKVNIPQFRRGNQNGRASSNLLQAQNEFFLALWLSKDWFLWEISQLDKNLPPIWIIDSPKEVSLRSNFGFFDF